VPFRWTTFSRRGNLIFYNFSLKYLQNLFGQPAGVAGTPSLPNMPQDQKFRPCLHRGQDRADADFPSQIAVHAMAMVISGLGGTHLINLRLFFKKFTIKKITAQME